jgi:acetyl-CoA C-acetyltransferase
MGDFGEAVVQAYQFTRSQQDRYASESLTRAQDAIARGDFRAEITPVRVPSRKGDILVSDDEHPGKVSVEKLASLKPAFRADGTITAASSSAIADGAAALLLMRRSQAPTLGLPVLAEIRAHATHAQEPARFATAPIPAIRKVLDKAGWTVGDVDLFEINEAFAVVAMAAAKDLGIARDRLNIAGGACALGHPIGASGARIVVTLLHALMRTGGKRGIASLCIGGGEATALAIELV